jgi:SPX domain protein involved in polyphosphate accumulation
MKTIEILIYAILIIILLYFIIFNIIYFKKNSHFLKTNCKNGICYENFDKCYSLNGYIYHDDNSDKKIERKTLKCILNTEDKYKLLKLENILVPSLMNGTFCDILYTTYYDYSDFTILKNRVYNLNMPLTKCIRIRHYHFQPGKYFEIKYKGGTKIRALIDDNYNLLEEDKLDEEYKDTIQSILDKIKSNKVKPIFKNTYKRMSFIYKNNPEMRITIDSNIEFFHNNIYKLMDNDVFEFKLPYSVSIELAQQYLNEINNLIGTNLKYGPFSKFEYYYYKVILNQN